MVYPTGVLGGATSGLPHFETQPAERRQSPRASMLLVLISCAAFWAAAAFLVAKLT